MALLFTCYFCLEFHNIENNEHKLIITILVFGMKRVTIIFGTLF